jgi:hypothetical protein
MICDIRVEFVFIDQIFSFAQQKNGLTMQINSERFLERERDDENDLRCYEDLKRSMMLYDELNAVYRSF